MESDHVLLVREVLVNGSETFRSVRSLQIFTSSYRCCYYVLFGLLQISTLLYESVSLLIVIRISVKACIDVTLYDELFNHLHNREKFLSPLVTKDKF